ncbi:Trans-Golgi network integral membrane protein 2 [Caenorhabditis elegans]|uniref:Trans-Golgi network integral membrane protein 2 n=1 Tax=Caenorhabditis elegans TaxID=6239 RepID=G5EFW0_CAEEL|nr:Trans-Golgi network integral membrane protein 2 [Caenorhabditis elegans]CAM82780.1 Trans-Golgi network integral membrane protein 2 [Caenorhabditis elegans]|eukprot:NP_001255605.1 Trans-Golgi Network protein homolog [Caenorhabditis elegans]
MKLRLFVVVLLFLATSAAAQEKPEDDVNPEDVDDVRPPIDENENEKEGKSSEKSTTPPTLTLLSSTANLTIAPDQVAPIPVATNATIIESKTENEKKEELLTGKEETPPAKTDVIQEATTVVVETIAPFAQKAPKEVEDAKEEEKENAAPEFEPKQEVEGGKGEEDPDANVDKPAVVDPPKDEADGAAKEDRETPAVGAEGLHEAVEEARGNPAPGVPVAEKKKDSADEEQTLEAGPVARPHRHDSSNEFQSFPRIRGAEEDGTGFMSFFFVASFLIVAIYLLQHNKKKILGLMFEGRTGRAGSRRSSGGNVRYRRLSQNEAGN